ncbi:MAG: hypothetical protein AAF192_11235 [Pseudomonadota bacterium]
MSKLPACLAAAVVLATAACESKAPEPVVETALIQPDCYSVTPFRDISIASAPDGASDAAKAFLGAWGGGAWDGAVCHDLWVLSLDADGQVVMFDAHGPGFDPDATGFTRRGEVGEDGRLRVRKGRAQVEYWVEDGRLYGERRIGDRLNRVILVRQTG